MADIRILIGDRDKRYIMALERRFIDEYDGNCELYAVTDKLYMSKLFSSPQSFDIMLVSEDLYSPEFIKHEIANIFILTEKQKSTSNEEELNVSMIYKYASVKEICNQVMSNLSSQSAATVRKRGTEIISVYSPSGGSGKTTVSFGLCAALAKKYKKVLYIGIDPLQSFGCFMEEAVYMQPGFEKPLRTKSEYITDIAQKVFKEELFYILPPFERSLTALGIGCDEYIFLVQRLKEAGIFDIIVIDCVSAFNEDISGIMSISDRVAVLAEYSTVGLYKIKKLLDNIDCSDDSKFTLLLTKYRKEIGLDTGELRFFEKIPFVEDAEDRDYMAWSDIHEIDQLAVRYI